MGPSSLRRMPPWSLPHPPPPHHHHLHHHHHIQNHHHGKPGEPGGERVLCGGVDQLHLLARRASAPPLPYGALIILTPRICYSYLPLLLVTIKSGLAKHTFQRLTQYPQAITLHWISSISSILILTPRIRDSSSSCAVTKKSKAKGSLSFQKWMNFRKISEGRGGRGHFRSKEFR